MFTMLSKTQRKCPADSLVEKTFYLQLGISLNCEPMRLLSDTRGGYPTLSADTTKKKDVLSFSSNKPTCLNIQVLS